jgi:photosystem II stability/assembly factor-like uncharacterized protein
LVTHDGGQTWQQDRAHSTILALATRGTTVWTVEEHCAAPCTVRLIGSADAGRTWHLLTREQPLLDGNAHLIRINARDAWLLSCCQWAFRPYPFLAPRAVLLVTHDGGRMWRHVSDPCAASPGWSSRSLAALAPARLWLLCGGQPATDNSSEKVLFASHDGGQHWVKVAATCEWVSPWRCPPAGRGRLSLAGEGGALLLTTPTQGWITAHAGGLESTGDGGHTWRFPLPALVSYSSQVSVGPLVFTDPLHGWLAADCGVYHTTDGGSNWHLFLVGCGCGSGFMPPPPDSR